MSQPPGDETNDPFAPPPEQPAAAPPPPPPTPQPWEQPYQPPATQPPAYGQPPAYDQPPAYGQQPPPYGAPPGYGQQPPPPPYGAATGVKPPTYLPWAVAATILCCLPLGIASIVFANQVNVKYAQHDLAGAMEASQKARNFAIASAVIGPIIAIIYVLAAGSH
jgi:hypothetical protein